MRSIKKVIGLIPVVLLATPILASCNNNPQDGTIYLKVLNSEDYIYKYDSKEASKPDGNKNPDLTVQFEQYMAKKGKKVRVIYDTFDTMENMFNTLKTGKTKYDLVCASEYMVQKLAKTKINNENIIEPIDTSLVPNYYNDNYTYGTNSACSPYIREKLSNVPAIGKVATKEDNLDNYCMCYMWGTLGILYNPTFDMLVNRGLSKDKIMFDMTDWGSLWNPTYKKTIAIKDSMRDTYAIGVMHKYENELINAGDDFIKRNTIFNYGGEADPDYVRHINEVKDDLLKLRNNVFGFEVDSGKQDIVTGKIGIDTAWSGDAVHSMDDADEIREKDPSQAPILYYSIPDKGTNLWFDCWVLQKGANKEISHEFLNFISDPKNVIQNMDYIGYTSPIAGKETFDYFSKTYDVKQGEYEQYDVSYFFNKKDDLTKNNHYFKIDKEEINRQIAAQFPSEKVQKKLMIMQDYGANNDLILKMWEQVKHESLPVWAIVLLSIEGGLVVGGITIFVTLKVKDKKRRKLRKLPA